MRIGTSILRKERVGAQPTLAAWPLRWRVARLLAVQELRDALFGWSFYLTAAIGPLLMKKVAGMSWRFNGRRAAN